VGNLGFATGYVVHTVSGGQAWFDQLQISRHFYYGVNAHHPWEATVTGSLDSFFTNAGLIARTNDAGNHWQERRFLKGIGKVDFVDSLRGWAYAAEGDSARFIHTKDGGQTWTIQRYDLNVLFQLRGFDFVDSLHGWAMGRGGGFDDPVVLGTRNGGDTWEKLYGFPFDGTSRIFTDIDFADSLNGWLIGSAIVGGFDQGEIYRTTDGGSRWTVEIRDAKFFPTNGFALDQQHAWAVTTQGEVWRYGLITSIDEPKQTLPTSYLLAQNYPNPFNPITKIEYHLPKRTEVVLTVYDILGKEVKVLVQKMQGPGRYQVEFDASGLTGGNYFYTLKAGDFEETKQMLLVK
jgi:hypothetical protein